MKIHLEPDILWKIFGFPVSNSLLLSVLTGILLTAFGLWLIRSLRLVPGRTQFITEELVNAILRFVESVVGDKEQAKKFFPLVASFFLFILFNNWLGILPGVGTVGLVAVKEGKEIFIPFLRSAASDFNTTLALALVSVISSHIYGIRQLGILTHVSKFINFRNGPIYFFVGLLELLGELAKILSFSFRLFGNMFAGKVLLLVIMTLVPFLAPLPFLAVEIFIGFIQAVVFAALTLIFLKVATETATGH